MEGGVKNHITDEAFRQFHTIDREFFAALTRLLRRDPAESLQVAAFLMWLEKECRDYTIIKRVLSLPLVLINAVADEAALCVRCVESDSFLTGDGGSDVSFLSEFLKFPARLSLRFLHDNRIAVLGRVAKKNIVCWRAFSDLFCATTAPPPPHPMQFVFNPRYQGMPVSPLPAAARLPPPAMGQPMHVRAAGGFPVAAQHHAAGDMMRMNSKSPIQEREKVAADDRTIFLTFRRRQPTTEEEIREYFTRRFGDFIENLIMQVVERGEQPLYAIMVAKSAAVIDRIVEVDKAKYSINGKDVWARKYVKKSRSPWQPQRLPPRGETSGSSPAKKA